MSDQPPQPQRPPKPDELPTNVPAIITMEPHRRHEVRAWIGFLLIVLGFLAFAVSYFLLPVFVVVCFYDCGTPGYSTAWELSLYGLSGFPQPPFGAALVLSALPLFAAMTILGCSICFLVDPHLTFATWSYWAWAAGFIALLILFTLLIFLETRPAIGYVGMLLSYGVLLGGNFLFFTRRAYS